MSFEIYEESRDKGAPIDLYFFKYGDTPNAYYAYTDHDEEVTVDGVVYSPSPLMRGSVIASGTLDKASLEVRTFGDSDVAELFRIYPPAQVVTLIIRQGHVGDPDAQYLVVWTGRILSCGWEGGEAKLQGEPISTSMKRSGLRRHYQYGCPHVLYGSQCRANILNATVQRTVIAVQNSSLTLDDGWVDPATVNNYIGGMVAWAGGANREFRTILRVRDFRFVDLAGSPRGIVAGMTVDVILGCNRQMTHCANLHNNIHNYGGQPWIPTKNPIKLNNFW